MLKRLHKNKIIIYATTLFFGLHTVIHAQGVVDTNNLIEDGRTHNQTMYITDGIALPDSVIKGERFSYHFQTTMIDMYHPDFSAPYTGSNSLQKHEKDAMSVTSTMFLGFRLWKGGQFYFDPELSGGEGFSGTDGIAGFPNGEVYRVGSPLPVITGARYYIRQTIQLGSSLIFVDGGQNQLKNMTSADRLVFTLGKFALADMFDCNTFSHDPRNQFINWAIMTAGAWDYASNTRGYTWGIAAELIHPGWALRGSIAMEPQYANGPYMDMDIYHAHAENVEFDKMFSIHKNPGIIRVLSYYNQANMGSYSEAIKQNPTAPVVTDTRSYAHDKWGFVINAEQQVSSNVGIFGRFSWDNGTSETWAFTEIDHSLSLGAQLKGNIWKRPTDNFGAAILVNGLSKDHRDYLATGGNGFILGDGHLNYGMEQVVEIYYSAKLFDNFWLSPDYQLVINPGYNQDRGPIVHVLGIRGHIEF